MWFSPDLSFPVRSKVHGEETFEPTDFPFINTSADATTFPKSRMTFFEAIHPGVKLIVFSVPTSPLNRFLKPRY